MSEFTENDKVAGGGTPFRHLLPLFLPRTRKAVAFVFLLLFSPSLPSCEETELCKTAMGGCPEGSTCYVGTSASKNAKGICVEGEMLNGQWVAMLREWKLLLMDREEEGQEVVPLQWDEREAPGSLVGVSSVGEKSAALVEAVVAGLKPGERLKVWAGWYEAICNPTKPASTGLGDVWKCFLWEGWALLEPGAQTVKVTLQPGLGAKHTRIYRVQPQSPDEGEKPPPGGGGDGDYQEKYVHAVIQLHENFNQIANPSSSSGPRIGLEDLERGAGDISLSQELREVCQFLLENDAQAFYQIINDEWIPIGAAYIYWKNIEDAYEALVR